MRIFIKTKPSAKRESVKKIDDTNYIVSVREPAKEGKANLAVIKALAEYFKVGALSVDIISGHRNKSKIVEIKD